MKKVLVILALIPLLVFARERDYYKLTDHRWWELWFVSEHMTHQQYVLVRINSDWEIEMKRYGSNPIVLFKKMMDAHHYDYKKYHEIESGPFLDCRVFFTCDDFIGYLSTDHCIRGMKFYHK